MLSFIWHSLTQTGLLIAPGAQASEQARDPNIGMDKKEQSKAVG
jgi:hypothetical protein